MLSLQLLVASAAILRASAQVASREADPALVPCWEKGHSREDCCAVPSTCFDSIYTRAECCGRGWARLFPEAEAEPAAWEEGFQWAQRVAQRGGNSVSSARLKNHPSYSRAQRTWEAGIANSSILLSEKVLGQQLELHAFKRSGPALGKVLEELGDDLYRLRHVAPPPEEEAPVAVDIGASIGLVSILLCKLWAGIRVVALEPAPSNFRYLLWNLRANGVTDCVWPLNVAAGAAPLAVQTFFYSPTYPTWSQQCGSDCQGNDDSWRGGWTDWQLRFSVETATLAEVMAAFGLGDIHFLKVDCEGCEWGVFAPHAWARLRHRVRNIATELHSWALPSTADTGLEEAVRKIVCEHETVNENSVCSTM